MRPIPDPPPMKALVMFDVWLDYNCERLTSNQGNFVLDIEQLLELEVSIILL
jgi:hypothetical protein